MRFVPSLVLGLAVLWATPAFAQVPAAPSYDRVHATRLACERLAKCGCPEEKCHDNMLAATQLPIASFRCVGAMECGELCEKPAEGDKPKAVKACFDPKKWAALKKTYPDPLPVSTERHDTIVKACTQAAKCGCAEEECVLNFRAASGLPLASLSCLSDLECPKLCDTGAEFTQRPAYKQCFDPQVWPALKVSEKARSIGQYCEKLSTCGCAEAECQESFTKNTTSFGQDLFVCLNALSCGAVCEPKALTEGSQGHLGCIKPAMDRQKSQQALELARMRSTHNTNMSIIRAIGGTGTKVRVYDANGSYLRTE